MDTADRTERPGRRRSADYDVDRGVEVGRLGMAISAALLIGLVLAEIFVVSVGPPSGGLALTPLPALLW